MAIVVEDGTGITGANAYVSTTYLDGWAADRGYSLAAYTTEQKEAAIIIASKDWIDLYHTFKGEKLSDAQGLKMPTTENDYDAAWKDMASNAAYMQLRGLLLVDEASLSTSGTIQSEAKQLGTLSKSVTYADGTAQTYRRKTPALDAAIRPYLLAGFGPGDVKRW